MHFPLSYKYFMWKSSLLSLTSDRTAKCVCIIALPLSICLRRSKQLFTTSFHSCTHINPADLRRDADLVPHLQMRRPIKLSNRNFVLFLRTWWRAREPMCSLSIIICILQLAQTEWNLRLKSALCLVYWASHDSDSNYNLFQIKHNLYTRWRSPFPQKQQLRALIKTSLLESRLFLLMNADWKTDIDSLPYSKTIAVMKKHGSDFVELCAVFAPALLFFFLSLMVHLINCFNLKIYFKI